MEGSKKNVTLILMIVLTGKKEVFSEKLTKIKRL